MEEVERRVNLVETPVEGCGGKESTGADGVAAVDLAVHGEPAGDGGTFPPQKLNQLDERVELTLRGPGFFKITHEADADTACIHGMVAHVTPVQLPDPAIADLDHAVAGICPVADDKMVGEAIDHAPLFPMKTVIHGRVPPRFTALW